MENILLSALTPVIEAEEAALYDLGDGIACLEFRSKSNSISQGVGRFLGATLEEYMSDFDGLVIGNQAKNFSVGADLTRMRKMCAEADTEGLRSVSAGGQKRYGDIKAYRKPIVAAPYRHTLGGGLELALHCHRRVAHTDVRMGLVEAGVGLLPGGGGVKETALVALSRPTAERENALMIGFDRLICKKKSETAAQAFEMGYLQEGDVVVDDLEELLTRAKEVCRAMPLRPAYSEQTVRLPGVEMYRKMLAHTDKLIAAGELGPYDRVIAERIATVLTGGDVAPCEKSESELLAEEQNQFAALAGDPRTCERIAHLLDTGNLLKN